LRTCSGIWPEAYEKKSENRPNYNTMCPKVNKKTSLDAATAKFLGVKDSFKPGHNIDAGTRYFKQLLDQFDGKVKLALAAYNAGIHNVRKYGGIPPFKATQIYIDKVLKYYEAYQTT
jgi:hypothetical protein